MAGAQVSYNGNRLIPAPLWTVTKDYNRAADGEKLGTIFNITLNGNLVAFKGSPTSSGTWWTTSDYPPDESQGDGVLFSNLLRKQEAIRKLFAQDGLSLEAQPCDGSTSMKCNPRIKNITFPNGLWVQKCDYQIECEADYVLGLYVSGSGEDAFSQFISDASESWQLEFNDEPESATNQHSFRLQHSISAKGKLNYDVYGIPAVPWQEAQKYVLPRLGINNALIASSGGMNLNSSAISGYNYSRLIGTDVLGGTYSVTENWILSSGSAFEDFTITAKSGIDVGTADVTVEGTIRGLEVNSFGTNPGDFTTTKTKYQSASGLWSTIKPQLFTRANTYAQTASFPRPLNSTPVNTVLGQNPVGGTITYSYDYNTRPTNNVTGALSEVISIVDNNPNDMFAKVFVLGRQKGPVLTSLNTISEASRNISIEIVTLPVTGFARNAAGVANWYSQSPSGQVDDIITAFYDDLTNNYTQVFIAQDTENWNPQQGRYSRQVAMVYQGC